MLNNLCYGDTLRFAGDSLNPGVYGTISGYVYNSSSSSYDNFSVTSFNSIATTYDHILVQGDSIFNYQFMPYCGPLTGHLLFNCINNLQCIAGVNDSTQIISFPNINLSNSVSTQALNAFIDLDCDSIADIKFSLYKGATAIDIPNSAIMYVLNPDFLVCADTSTLLPHQVTFFNYGDTITDSDSTAWFNDTIYRLGNYGCFECFGPYAITNKYIGFYNSNLQKKGWIKISFDVADNGVNGIPITLSVTEILSPCANTFISADPNTSSSSGNDSCGIFYYNYSITPESCAGSCDGSIEITGLTGGTPGYTYLWNDAASQTSSTAQYLCSGIYSVTFSDNNGNSCTTDFTVGASAINFTITVTNVSCADGSDGMICIDNIAGGSAPYQYTIIGLSNSFTPCFSNLDAGSYTVCVTDANGCMTCTTATIQQPPPIEIDSVTIYNPSCNGMCNGEICVTGITGGVGNYTFIWSTGETTLCTYNACEGNTQLCIIDGNGCTVCTTFVLTAPDPLIVTDTVTNASCATCCDGNIQLTVTGGTIPYTIDYTPAPNPFPGNFCPGNYNYCITDGNGCTVCDSATVTFTAFLEEIYEDQYFVFPNPNEGDFMVGTNVPVNDYTIYITNPEGKIVYSKKMNGLSYPGKIESNLQPGIYFLFIGTDSGKEVMKTKVIISK
ncbi:MAG: T9SS type A sorting domain-containing protein [Bacteroidota bacterium]